MFEKKSRLMYYKIHKKKKNSKIQVYLLLCLLQVIREWHVGIVGYGFWIDHVIYTLAVRLKEIVTIGFTIRFAIKSWQGMWLCDSDHAIAFMSQRAGGYLVRVLRFQTSNKCLQNLQVEWKIVL